MTVSSPHFCCLPVPVLSCSLHTFLSFPMYMNNIAANSYLSHVFVPVYQNTKLSYAILNTMGKSHQNMFSIVSCVSLLLPWCVRSVSSRSMVALPRSSFLRVWQLHSFRSRRLWGVTLLRSTQQHTHYQLISSKVQQILHVGRFLQNCFTPLVLKWASI